MKNNELLKYGSVVINPNLNTQSYYKTNVIVVGCGGTGGRLIPGLAQHIANHNRVIKTVPNNKQFLKHEIGLTFIDADEVETKNLLRQNFHTFDVGRNKAEVMATRYGALNGIDINFIPSFILPGSKTFEFSGGESNTIVFDCTDNVKARREIETQIKGYSRVIISCGNEDTFGQVLLSVGAKNGTKKTLSLIDDIDTLMKAIESPSLTYKGVFNKLPTLLELFTGFKDTVAPSCTDIVLQDAQSMPINALVAQLAYNVFYNLVAGNKFTYNMVKCSTNNIYDTKFVNHPIALCDLYLKALFGDSSKLAKECFTEAITIGLYKKSLIFMPLQNNLETVKIFAKKYGKYAKPYIGMYLESNYNVSPQDILFLSNACSEQETADANL